MSPIERLRRRSKSLHVLGLGPDAGPDEIRHAWKRRAYACHPDRGAEAEAGFDAARAAYAYLTGEDDTAVPEAPRRASRPVSRVRAEDLTDADVAACQRRLAEEYKTQATDHVPFAQIRAGRMLTFVVRTEMQPGLNRIALPTTALAGRRSKPVVVRFRPERAGPGDMVLTDALRDSLFPGAKDIRIRFGRIVA